MFCLPPIKLCAHPDPANPQHGQLYQHFRACLDKNPRPWEFGSAPGFQRAGRGNDPEKSRSSQKIRHEKSTVLSLFPAHARRCEVHCSGAESPLPLYTACSKVHSAGAHKADGRLTKEPTPFERLPEENQSEESIPKIRE